ncbi:GNAT family N-acetyltransferase [Halorientalis salina]|uniref:GNAT family N-acetyltransferase n=1 Tax=Halorientalis salina TaxID=2932266 RepID=UPI0010ABB241|nr:GNAT family N-acetyltransferase [Halorientalis salina]
MELTEQLDFSHRGRKDIYEYVERHGLVDPDATREALGMEPREFGHHVAILRRDGVLAQTDDDQLQIAYDEAAEEEYEEAEIEFTIRQARQEDITGLVGVMRSVVEDGSYVVAESIADMIDHEEVLLRHNELESRMFFVASVEGEVVGWVHLNHPEIEKLSHTAELTVGVLTEYREYGIGSHLLQRGLEWANSHGYEKIYNSIPSSNEAAIEFLETHDWHEEARREDHYMMDGDYVDEVMMEITL